jgi:hypothetical protein
MTRDDIIRLAREASGESDYDFPNIFSLERFAALVAAAEREACAKVCEEQIKSYMSKKYTTDPLGGFRERFAAGQCAAAIRVRGET